MVRTGKKDCVYITFDDGPHPANTQKILQILSNQKTKAIFFMIGKNMEKYPDLVEQVKEHGHEIGFHSYSHRSLKKQSFFKTIHDFSKRKELESRFGIKMKLYRPPFGDLTILSLLWVVFSGLKIVMWSLDSRDSFDSKEQVLDTVHPDKVSAGEILLFHDDYDHTVEIMPEVVEKIRKYQQICKSV